MNHDSEESVNDDGSVEGGRRKKKRGLLGGKAPPGSAPVNGGPGLDTQTVENPSEFPSKPVIYEAENEKTAPAIPKPIIVPDRSLGDQLKTAARNVPEVGENPKVLDVLPESSSSLNLATIKSDASPRISSRSKLPNPLHGPSKLVMSTSTTQDFLGSSINTPKSGGEPSTTKKTTPRPLPPHLKQAFTSSTNSPRTSLNASTTHSLTEELVKSMATITTSSQPTSFLRRVSTRDVRTRSYLMGCLGSQLSLGGKPELEYFFPDRLLRVYAGSWNMAATKTLPNDLECFVLPDYTASDYSSPAPHIFVFGTQETMGDKRRWLLKLQEVLGQHFVCLCSAGYGALGLAVFIRRELIWYASAPKEATFSPRPYQPIATKGSLAVSFELFGTSFLFLTSHFAAGEGNVESRVEDYRRTVAELKLEPLSSNKSTVRQRPLSSLSAPSIAQNIFTRRIVSAAAIDRRPISADDQTAAAESSSLDVTAQFDCCIWMGDFNFRVTRSRQHVDEVIKGFSLIANAVHPTNHPTESETQAVNSHELLLDHDEMSKEMSRGRIFSGFNEGKIRFKPTYKYDIGSNNYDTSSKGRIQSYTDRIVYRSRRKNAVTCLAYRSEDSVKVSDHKPVFGVYDIELRPGLDSIPTGAGSFDRSLYLEGLKNRAQLLTTDKSSTVCSIQ